MNVLNICTVGALLVTSPAVAQQAGQIPPQYVGKWEGILGKGEAKSVQQVRTATVTKDFGHIIEEFEFEVADDGAITGSGKAKYWFNVSSETDLIVTRITPTAYLEGNTQTLDFTIEGQMTPEGKVKLRAVPQRELTLINAGDRQTMGAWNVFGPFEEEVHQVDCKPALQASRLIDQLGMKLEWTAERKCGIDCAVDRNEGGGGVARTAPIDLVVIHSTGGPDCNSAIAFRGGTLGSNVRHFRDNDRGVSIHYIVGEDGTVVRMVSEDQIAFHITGSALRNRSLGIELVNDGNGTDPYPHEQILGLVDLLVEILCTYGLDSNAVRGHEDLDTRSLVCNGVQAAPRRRVDPGPAFPWEVVRTLIDARLAEDQ
jgi:N-acetylmuramoyl-L-alanine amidase